MPPAGLDREALLAAALRENLRKRKAQARARADGDAARARAEGDAAQAGAEGDGSAAGEPPGHAGGRPTCSGDEAERKGAAPGDSPAKP